jgi:outer membrane receptor protein involved in Fe transport
MGIGYLSPIGLISAEYNNYTNENNFLLPNGNPIGLNLQNHIATLKGNFPLDKFILKPKFNYQRNNRKASKPGLSYTSLPDSAAVNLELDVYTARFDVENVDVLDLSGTIGFEVKYYDHRNVGLVPLQPTGHFTNYSIYIFEEWQQNKLTLNAGARFDYRDQKFEGTTTNPLLQADDERNYTNISGSIGASYKLTENLTTSLNLSRGFRTPSFFNLYVYGEHGGVFAFQIGNPELKNETSLDINASLRFQNEFVKSSASFFYNRVDNYIFLYNAPNHPLAPTGKPFVFAHDQADAMLYGFEFNVETQIAKWLVLFGDYSTIRSEFLDGPWKEGELPLMPPNRISAGTKLLLPDFSFVNNPYISVDARFVSSKNAAGIYEPFGQFDDGIGPDLPFGVCSTTDYSVFNAGIGFTTKLLEQHLNFYLEITNLLDEDYRDFLDTYKGYTLSLGRSINLKINLLF